ncbi:8-amino-7-oxononanoate synthase [Acetobacteraceae bacterium]|nr:8-amino-7-oxononanoate synthase [Acetobacteraceae bacterium]
MNLLNQALEISLRKRQAEGLLRKEASPLPKHFIDLSSNDYLNLSKHPTLKAKAKEWTENLGVGATGSRLISGSYEGYAKLEKQFAAFKGAEASLLFNSGWQANASILPALNALSKQATQKPALFFMDKLCHASMIFGANNCQAGLSKAKILRFRHNDLKHLEKLLEAEKETKSLKFILTESIFSMDGDRADLESLIQLKNHYHATLYVDEAHATGLFGKNGSGLCDPKEIELILSTGSKALGASGAFLSASQKMKAWLWNMASGFVYSTALPPAVLGALQGAIETVPEMTKERTYLLKLAEKFRILLKENHWNYLESNSQIIPLLVGEPDKALRLQEKLQKEGFRCGAIRPPTVPPNTARLRFTMQTNLNEKDLYKIIEILGQA